MLENFAIDYVGAAVAAASNTDDNSSRLDMSRYDGVMFVCALTDSADTGVGKITIETNSADSDTGMTASACIATATSAANDDLNGMLLIADLEKPLERYVQGVRTSTVANIAFGTITAIRYRAGKKPVVQSSTTVAHGITVVDS